MILTFTIILGILLLLAGYVAGNLMVKVEKQEDIINEQNKVLTNQDIFINKLSDTISYASNRLDEIDEKGIFKADDEIGWMFEEVMKVKNILNEFIIVKNDATNTET